jgi:hypothetical protein
MKKRQSRILNRVIKKPNSKFAGMTRDLAHHLVQKYGNEVFRIGARRFGILALTEIGCTVEEIADAWRLSIRTVKRHQCWIKRNMSVAIASAEERPGRAEGLATAQAPPPEAEKVIAEYLADAPASAAEKTPIPVWAKRVIAEYIPDATGKPWGKAIADWMKRDSDNYHKLLEVATSDEPPHQGSRGGVTDPALKPIQQFVIEEEPEGEAKQ